MTRRAVRMRRLRAQRRARGLCPRCGLDPAPPDRDCDECNRVRRLDRVAINLMVVTPLPDTASDASH